MKLFLLVLVSLSINSCESPDKKSSSKKKKDGVVKQYRADGSLKTMLTYERGMRNGPAKSYYKNGKLRQEIDYVNNVKHGMVTTYYENGRKYQETPYDNNKIEGTRKKYRMNGKLMSEIPYIDNEPCAGLVEYLLNGDKKTEYPDILIQPIDNLLKNNQYSLILTTSDGSKDVEYFSGELLENGCIPHYVVPLGNIRRGQAEVTYDLPPNSFIMERLNFIAKIKTKLGNPYIIEISHNLAIENK